MVQEQQSISVNLQRIVFKNNDSGFLIGAFMEESGKNVSALGNLLNPETGMDYKLYGKWITNKKYGKQFQFEFYEVIKPKSTAGIFRYLVRIAKWVGPSVGERLVTKYDTETLEILKKDPERVVKEIRGITLDRALEIQKLLIDNEKIESTLVELEGIFSKIPGIKKSLPVDMINKFGADAIQRLKDNPYILTQIRGMGFLTTDRVAISIGVDRASENRIVAAIYHVLQEDMHSTGNVWIYRPELIKKVRNLIALDATETIAKLVDKNQLAYNDAFVTLDFVDSDETSIAKKLQLLLDSKPDQAKVKKESEEVVFGYADNTVIPTVIPFDDDIPF